LLAKLNDTLDRENWVLPRGSGERGGWRGAVGFERLGWFRLHMARGARLDSDCFSTSEPFDPFK
jgi:hypothetical protein